MLSNRFVQQRDASIQLILQVGLELFAGNGFQATTVRMIAEKAGISLGLLYNYFKSKEEVLQAIFLKLTKEIQQEWKESIVLDSKPSLSVFTRLFLKNLKSFKSFWLLFYHISLSGTTALLVSYEVNGLRKLMQEILEDCLLEAEIPFPNMEAILLMAALDGLAQQYLLQEKFPINDIMQLLLMKYASNPK